MTEPTDNELDALILQHWPAAATATLPLRWIRTAFREGLAKWGMPPAVAGEKVYLVATGLTNEAGTVGLYERHEKFVPLADCEVLYTTPPAQAADSVLEDVDPLQGAANWLAEAHGQFGVAVLQGCLMIGYNRAKRLHDAAIAARKQGGA